MNLELRPGVLSDARAIAEILLSARREAMPWLPELHTDEATRAWIGNVVLVTRTVRVAEVDGRPVGFAAFGAGMLDHLYVAPGFQGMGIGTALLLAARNMTSGPLSLYAFQRNSRARAFYEAHGFRPVSFGDGSTNEENEPDALYTLDVI